MQLKSPNQHIRFFTQPKSSMRQTNPQSIRKILTNESEFHNIYPDHLAQHRKYIISDYQKKVDQIKNLKQRFSYTQRVLRKPQNTTANLSSSIEQPRRAKTQRKSRQYQTDHSLHSTFFSLNNSTISTIMMENSSLKQQPNLMYQKQAKTLSQFQKSVLKRLKTRQNMIIKKKFDSFYYDQKHTFAIQPQQIRLQSEKMRIQIQKECLSK